MSAGVQVTKVRVLPSYLHNTFVVLSRTFVPSKVNIERECGMCLQGRRRWRAFSLFMYVWVFSHILRCFDLGGAGGNGLSGQMVRLDHPDRSAGDFLSHRESNESFKNKTPAELYVPSNKTFVPACARYIPAIIVPVLWEVDLLPKNIWTIDVPTKKIIIVVNQLELPAKYAEENNASRQMRNVITTIQGDIPDKFLEVILTGENMGFARSMNLGMRKVMTWAPWWLCANADISYPPASLMSIVPHVWEDYQSGTVLYMLGHGFSAIIFTRHLISKVGLYDEHIWPAYVEDCDLMLRVRMAVGDVNIDNHEGGAAGKYYYLHPEPAFHHIGGQGSSSNSGYRFAARIREAHANNIQYYLKKWGVSLDRWYNGAGIYKHGCGIPMEDQYQSPFNLSRAGVWESLPFVAEHDRKQKYIFRV
mmetsp:Transcript_14460/g.59002  ORF Transcript_14460/g.59002 Transcript_14460/m.59002 type:complete len:419 (-) Transcript_14460:5613-6869(-)